MNRIEFIGRPTRDIELKLSRDKSTVYGSFFLAINRPKRKDQKKAEADFPSIIVYGKLAENVSKYVHKGDLISVEGRVETSSYTTEDGRTIYTTAFVASRIEFLNLKVKKDAPEFVEVDPSDAGAFPDTSLSEIDS